MNKIKLDEMNLLEFGNDILIGGVIYSRSDQHYICLLPEENCNIDFSVLELNNDEWKKIIRQTDLRETEILEECVDGKLTKAIVRKSTRIIELEVSWKVFKRDDYKCRYCGRDGIPLTVDHLVIWEKGGSSIEENLVTSCKKCNKRRGSLPYEEWLEHPRYRNLSQNLTPEIRDLNLQLVSTLDGIPLRIHKRGR